ncbi:MAG TPA: hypothetical protein PKD37_06760 [Oligoflexia bacterium]|nr:hypothetical protein [Oligoflexia bacterium]HMP27663.1 hypothetical protein [Oligoflexia bacterium]
MSNTNISKVIKANDRDKKNNTLSVTETAIKNELNDPIADWFSRNWRLLSWFILSLVIIYLIYQGYVSSQHEANKRAGDLLATTLNQLDQLEALHIQIKDLKNQKEHLTLKNDNAEKEKEYEKLTVKINEEREKFHEIARTLSLSREPYNQLATIIEAVAQEFNEQPNQNNEALLTLATRWQEQELNNNQRFLSEIAALIKTKQLLTLATKNNNTSQLAAAKEEIFKLAEAGKYVALPAAFSYAEFAANSAELKKALELLKKLTSQYPEQVDLLNPVIEKLETRQNN